MSGRVRVRYCHICGEMADESCVTQHVQPLTREWEAVLCDGEGIRIAREVVAKRLAELVSECEIEGSVLLMAYDAIPVFVTPDDVLRVLFPGATP